MFFRHRARAPVAGAGQIFTFEGRALPNLPPTSLSRLLVKPSGPLSRLEAMRDRIDFGGDNHTDPNLASEVAQHGSGVQLIGLLMGLSSFARGRRGWFVGR
jgi:hypothetical protein